MRWMCWFAAVLAAGLVADVAAGFEPTATPGGCRSCNGGYGTMAAPACCFPCFGMVPGCCEARPTCCDHVWDGYCQGKAYRLQRHAMRQAMRPPLVPWEQPMWTGPVGSLQPMPETWAEQTVRPLPEIEPTEAPSGPVPLPDTELNPGT